MPEITPETSAKCEAFLRDMGMEPTPDALAQLGIVFLPCLRIISERGYHPEGNTWREAGWRGIMTDIRKKAQRLWYRGWICGRYDGDSATDLINFCGFYIRQGHQGKPWGDWGDPGTERQHRNREDDAAEEAEDDFAQRAKGKLRAPQVAVHFTSTPYQPGDTPTNPV